MINKTYSIMEISGILLQFFQNKFINSNNLLYVKINEMMHYFFFYKLRTKSSRNFDEQKSKYHVSHNFTIFNFMYSLLQFFLISIIFTVNN